MIKKMTVCSDLLSTNNCEALMRIVDHGDVDVFPPERGQFLSEYTLCATRVSDVKKCLDWLNSIGQNRYIQNIALIVNSSLISAEDVTCMFRVLKPHVQIEYADGKKHASTFIPAREQSENPFEDGIVASYAGVDVSSNPHPAHTEQHDQWEAGFVSA